MKKLLVIGLLALSIGSTASAKYDAKAVYKSGKVPQNGSWAYDGEARYTWHIKGGETICEVLEDNGNSYFIYFTNTVTVGYDNDTYTVEDPEYYGEIYTDENGNEYAYEEDCVLYEG